MSLLSEEVLKDVELKKLIDDEKYTRLENEYEKNRGICKKILETLYGRNDYAYFLKLQKNSKNKKILISLEFICLFLKYSNI